MILELNIMNFAIMENIQINFTKGFNILTGETGTGKSIIVKGLNMILGDRASKDMVKKGCDKAYIEGLFYIEDRKDIIDKLFEYGVESDDNRYLLITRDIYSSGRSVSRVNGRTITLAMLNDITKKLVDIHSQHEHQSLLNVNNHIKLIDSFARGELEHRLEEVKTIYMELDKKKKELASIEIDEVERDRTLDLYEYQLTELTKIDLDNYDEDGIFKKYNKMANVKSIESNLGSSLDILKGEGLFEKNILDYIRDIIKNIERSSEFDNNLGVYAEILEDAYYNLEELSNDLMEYVSGLILDEEEYSILGERIEFIESLKRKYGPSLDDVISYRDDILDKINSLKNNEVSIKRLESDIIKIESKLLNLSEEVSDIRLRASKVLTKSILSELKELNMNDVNFKINFSRKDYFSDNGIDDIEFLISTNLGEDLKPLSKVVSGGEMSRIMLAFKSVFADYDKIGTLIFDEIDTGISGMTAELVGEKISKIAKNHQVICISHLPQIASMADSHFLIEKKNLTNETQSFVKKLDYDERIIELSRLLGGSSLTDVTKIHAKEMLDSNN